MCGWGVCDFRRGVGNGEVMVLQKCFIRNNDKK